MVLYLKYRPQNLNEVAGQPLVVQTLISAFQTDKLSHAYLFCGPRGVGKTSTARILAKIVNCQTSDIRHQTSDIPCNKCDACISITNGSCLDLIEIDAASNRGIDDIRDLREKIKLSPTSLKKKVYIIDEVHMLTNEAFNALLKTLEEPPEHCLFILATTDPQKIPATILSRVTRLDFGQASPESLDQALKRVVKGEKIDIDEEALKLISRKADGSFRDGVKLLDQLSSLGEKITASLAGNVLKSADFETSIKLLELLSQKDTRAALNLVNQEESKGVNLKEFVHSILDLLRAELLIKHGASELIQKDFSQEKYQLLLELSQKFSSEEIVSLINSLLEALELFKVSSISLLPLEIALIESCENQPSKTVKEETVVLVSETHSGSNEQSGITQKNPEKSDNPDIRSSELLSPSEFSEDITILKDKWNYILETIRPYNFSLEAMLRSVKLDSAQNGLVILKVPYSFHQRILESPRNRDLLENVLADVLGKNVKVGTLLDTRPLKVEELANVELAADDEVIKLAAEIFNSEA